MKRLLTLCLALVLLLPLSACQPPAKEPIADGRFRYLWADGDTLTFVENGALLFRINTKTGNTVFLEAATWESADETAVNPGCITGIYIYDHVLYYTTQNGLYVYNGTPPTHIRPGEERKTSRLLYDGRLYNANMTPDGILAYDADKSTAVLISRSGSVQEVPDLESPGYAGGRLFDRKLETGTLSMKSGDAFEAVAQPDSYEREIGDWACRMGKPNPFLHCYAVEGGDLYYPKDDGIVRRNLNTGEKSTVLQVEDGYSVREVDSAQSKLLYTRESPYGQGNVYVRVHDLKTGADNEITLYQCAWYAMHGGYIVALVQDAADPGATVVVYTLDGVRRYHEKHMALIGVFRKLLVPEEQEEPAIP